MIERSPKKPLNFELLKGMAKKRIPSYRCYLKTQTPSLIRSRGTIFTDCTNSFINFDFLTKIEPFSFDFIALVYYYYRNCCKLLTF